MELASCHPAGAQNFALTPRFKKKKLWPPAYDIMRFFVVKETICFTVSEFEVTAVTVSSIRVKLAIDNGIQMEGKSLGPNVTRMLV
jgi:hypothetical protein